MISIILKLFIGLIVVVTVVKGYDLSEEQFLSEIADDDDWIENWNANFKVDDNAAVTIENLPYHVLIRRSNTSFCSGAIISTKWVITAASCINSMSITDLTVEAGSITFGSNTTVNTVANKVVHGLFNSTTSDYDYGLLEITGTFVFGTTINSISLPVQSSKFGLYPLTVAGWGYVTSASTSFSTVLIAVNLAKVPNIMCSAFYGSRATITDRMFCGGVLLFDGKGTCQGDLGGAVVNNRVLVGIASMGLTCGDSMIPSVFSRVSWVTSWIQEVTGISTTA